MQNGIYVEKISLSGDIFITKSVLLQAFIIFIIHQDLSFGVTALKIEFAVFVYELINYEIIKPGAS